MPVNAIDSQGTVWSLDGTLIGGVKSVAGLGSGSPGERDRTTMDDAKFKRFGVGLRDGGTATMAFLVDTTDAGQRKLSRYWREATRGLFLGVLTNGSTRSFYGYVMTFAEDLAADADVTASCSIRIDGEVSGFPDPT